MQRFQKFCCKGSFWGRVEGFTWFTWFTQFLLAMGSGGSRGSRGYPGGSRLHGGWAWFTWFTQFPGDGLWRFTWFTRFTRLPLEVRAFVVGGRGSRSFPWRWAVAVHVVHAVTPGGSRLRGGWAWFTWFTQFPLAMGSGGSHGSRGCPWRLPGLPGGSRRSATAPRIWVPRRVH
jgi:hypothetical protein